MKMNYEKIAELLTNANWDYQHNMERISENIMSGLIGALDISKITPDMVKAQCQNDTFDSDEIAAVSIADSIAQSLVECPYKTVTFTVVL